MILGGILASAVLLPCVFFVGPRAIDHFILTEAAWRLPQGTYAPSPWPQSFRFGILLPLAVLQQIFGVRPVAAAVLMIAASLLHVLSAYLLARTFFNRDAGLIAAAIVAVLPVETIQATMLYPDLLQTALSTLGLVLLVEESRRDVPRTGRVLGAGALFAASYLAKQTVALPLLFVAGWILAGRRWRLMAAAAPVLATIVVESLAIGRITGDPLYRHTGSNAFLADMNQRTFEATGPLGLLLRFPSLLWNPLDRGAPALAGLAFPFAAAAVFLRRDPGARFLLAFWGAQLLLMTVWPVRLRPYVPAMVADERHLFMLIAPMAAVAAAGLLQLRPKLRLVLAAGFAVVCLAFTAVIHSYLVRQDAGPRAAFAELQARGADSIHAVDPYGHDPVLYRYLSKYAASPRIESFRADDLPRLRNTWVVLDERQEVHRDRPEGVVRGGELFGQVPSTWTQEWSKSFPRPWDPRARGAGSYEMRLYRVP